MSATVPAQVEARDLSVGYGSRVILRDVDFAVAHGDIFVIMGGSGSGKSTLLRSLIGLAKPMRGSVLFAGEDLWAIGEQQRQALRRRFGVLYQHGALWTSMTVGENVALTLEQYSTLAAEDIRELVSFKLALVGLAGFEDYYPSELSGGMRKRAALARAMALDPEVLFLDEPGSGLDPVSSKQLDDLVLQLRDSLGATVVIVTHELASIFAIATNAIFIDAERQTVTAQGNPRELLDRSADPSLRAFLTRGEDGGQHGEAR